MIPYSFISLIAITLAVAVIFVKTDLVNGKKTYHSAAVPKGKSSKVNGKGLFGNSVLKSLMRDAKMAFCSELELLTLQVICIHYGHYVLFL